MFSHQIITFNHDTTLAHDSQDGMDPSITDVKIKLKIDKIYWYKNKILIFHISTEYDKKKIHCQDKIILHDSRKLTKRIFVTLQFRDKRLQTFLSPL